MKLVKNISYLKMVISGNKDSAGQETRFQWAGERKGRGLSKDAGTVLYYLTTEVFSLASDFTV